MAEGLDLDETRPRDPRLDELPNPPLRVVFMGTPDFAVPSLKALLSDPAFSVKLVITQPDKPTGRAQILTAPPVKEAAKRMELPVMQPEDIRKDFAGLHLPRPDVLVVVSYGQILSQEILDFPAIAPVNLHASLLPRWRGASPIQHAILAGDGETGVTVQRMFEQLDAGPILAQEKIPLASRETTQTLHDRLAKLGASLLKETLLHPLHPVPQDDAAATFCRKLARADGHCDPGALTAEEIDRKVRALTPWPGVTCPIKDEIVKILKTSLTEQPESLPLPCSKNTMVFIIELQSPGGKPMNGAAWMRGRR